MNVSEEANLVFKGVLFSVYQWEQERFDGSKSTYEMISRPDSAMVIPTIGEEILICRQEQPRTGVYYSLFGGQRDEKEEPLKAAQRELKEESGLESQDWELYDTFEPMAKFDWTMYLYIARNCLKTAEPHLDSGEKIEILDVSFERFVDIVQSKEFWGGELKIRLFQMEKEGTLDVLRNKLFLPK